MYKFHEEKNQHETSFLKRKTSMQQVSRTKISTQQTPRTKISTE